MIVKETTTINGIQYDRTYSNKGVYIERYGVKYSEAIDPLGSGRKYVETDELIENMEGELN